MNVTRNHRTLGLAVALAMSAAGADGVASGTGTTPEAEQPKEKAPGVGDLAKQLLRDGLGNKEVLAKVKEAFPEAKTSMSSINWYRNHLRGLGENVKTAREISADGKADEKAAKAAAKQAAKDAKAAEKAAEKEAKAKAKADEKAAKEAAKAAEKAAKTEGSTSTDAMLA